MEQTDLPQPEMTGLVHTQHPVLEVLEQAPWACLTYRAAPSYFFPVTTLPLDLSICLPEVNFQKQESPELGQGDEPRGSTR